MNTAYLHPSLRRLRPTPPKVTIQGREATATSPDGLTATMPLEPLLKRVMNIQPDTGEFMLPQGVKAVRSRGNRTLCVWEIPPRLHSLTWIASDSPAPYGPKATYRQVRIALPYLIILAMFESGGFGHLQLSDQNQCFFRNAPLNGFEDTLSCPALLNCYRFGPHDNRAISWICMGGIRHTPQRPKATASEQIWAGLNTIRHYLLETGFNHSDNQGGRLSWYHASRSLDPRLATIEAWEEASAQNPLFVLDIPWIKAERTLGQLIETILQSRLTSLPLGPSAAAMARIIFNHQKLSPPRPFVPEI